MLDLFNNEESISYVFWECPAAQDVWNQACPKIQKMSLQAATFIDLWLFLSASLTHMEISETAVIMKQLWHKRNDDVHSKEFAHPNILIRRTKTLLSNLLVFIICRSGLMWICPGTPLI